MKPTHIKDGLPHMVDVTHKNISSREAVVSTEIIHIGKQVKNTRESLIYASLTATTATKILPQFIPMTHPIPFTYIGNETSDISKDHVEVKTTVKANWYTGMEVEGYLGSLLYVLTFAFHQDKAFYHFIIKKSMLIYKSGGKSGTLRRHQGIVEKIYISQQKEKPFIKVTPQDPLFITNNPQMALRDQSYPILITNANLFTAKGYVEIGPHIMTITYREVNDEGDYLLMIAPNDEIAVIRKNHQITTLLVEED